MIITESTVQLQAQHQKNSDQRPGGNATILDNTSNRRQCALPFGADSQPS